jgi:hypothetical protein
VGKLGNNTKNQKKHYRSNFDFFDFQKSMPFICIHAVFLQTVKEKRDEHLGLCGYSRRRIPKHRPCRRVRIVVLFIVVRQQPAAAAESRELNIVISRKR